MPSRSGKSGHLGGTGGITGQMIEPVRPSLHVIPQHQARDRLQGPDDFLRWDLIVFAQKVDQCVRSQNVSGSSHLTNCLNSFQRICSLIVR